MPHSSDDRAACPFTPRELGLWRALLIAERDRITDDLQRMEGEREPTERIGIASNHPAEGASSENDRRLIFASAEEEGAILRLVERAVAKIDHEVPLPFGICEWTRLPIERERLALMPWTPVSIAGALYCEANGLEVEDLMAEADQRSIGS